MDLLGNLRLEFRRDSDKDRDCFVYLTANLPEGHPLRRRLGCGEGGIELFFARADFLRFAECGRDVFKDIYVTVDVCGDRVVVADTRELYDPCRETRMSSIAPVPYVTLEIPGFVRRWMGKVARRVWDNPMWKSACREGSGDYYEARCVRPRVDVTDAMRARFARLYGQGKGNVRIDASAEALARIEQVRSIAVIRQDDSFMRSMERVECIARNTTRGRHQTARILLSKDLDGFYWVAYTPDGRFIMNGGIVYHGPHDAYGSAGLSISIEPHHGWSVHT